MFGGKYKGWHTKIVLRDKSEFEGDLMVDDKEGNIILKNAELLERNGKTRYLGLVVIRGSAISYSEVVSRPFRNTAGKQMLNS